MAEILLFRRKAASAPVSSGSDEWAEDDALGSVDLDLVAELAAVPSQTLAELAHKVEVLLLRLVPNGEADGCLCSAEAALLRSVSREIRQVASDAALALRDTGQLAPMAAEYTGQPGKESQGRG